MATSGSKDVGCNLVKDRVLKLEAKRNRHFTGIVVLADMLMVVDSSGCSLLLYRLSDGKLLASSDGLQSLPFDICLLRGTQVVVTRDEGQIEILSVKSTSQPSASLSHTITLNVTKGFDRCHGVTAFRSGKHLAVSGVKRDPDTRKMLICWGIVSLADGNVFTIRTICKGFWSYLAASPDDSVVYFSCNSGDTHDTGVYAFDVRMGSRKFVYRPSELKYPRGISVDTMGNIYVCNNLSPPCIHHLTDSGEALTVYKEGIPHQPWGIYWEEKQEGLYVTGTDNEIWRFRLKWSNQQGDQKTSEIVLRNTERQTNNGNQYADLYEEIYFRTSNLTILEECAASIPRFLFPGKKYHAFFSYSSTDIQFVKEIVERLEKNHRYVCCEYDRDNTPGTPLLTFVDNSITNANKTVVVMTPEAVQSDFVLHEIDMAIMHGFSEYRQCVIPLLYKDCEVPLRLKAINYVDARNTVRREVWWPKLLSALDT
ncbi:hypothetical protein ACJMK2_018903 [Sinanodonta woodiana]|uniref:TIR domain-containing protein n=1 Tax=Sinanodonta woodiana TaxID=1069815 RepID=A0ABD3UHJ4_SINWO